MSQETDTIMRRRNRAQLALTDIAQAIGETPLPSWFVIGQDNRLAFGRSEEEQTKFVELLEAAARALGAPQPPVNTPGQESFPALANSATPEG